MQPTAMELDIIFEDSALIALNKPAGRVVHPSCGHLTGKTLQNGVLHRYKDLQYPDKMISPAHRLDRYTTGVIIYSRTREAYRELTRFFRENSAHKTYLAITEGAPNWDELKIDAPIAELPENPELRWVAPIGSSKNAKAALTRFRVLERGKNWSLLEAGTGNRAFPPDSGTPETPAVADNLRSRIQSARTQTRLPFFSGASRPGTQNPASAYRQTSHPACSNTPGLSGSSYRIKNPRKVTQTTPLYHIFTIDTSPQHPYNILITNNKEEKNNRYSIRRYYYRIRSGRDDRRQPTRKIRAQSTPAGAALHARRTRCLLPAKWAYLRCLPSRISLWYGQDLPQVLE